MKKKAYYNSPIGVIEIQSNQEYITNITFVDEKVEKESDSPLLSEAKQQLKNYFAGNIKSFNLPITYNGTAFQNLVWKELMNIPFGETASYKDIAQRIGNEKAVRAVGNANNKNKISIIIPCHRVIGSNGKLIGYGGGLWRKQWLLEHEIKINNKLV